MNQIEMRRILINSAIHVISQEGIDRATTKSLAKNAGVNEVYIYRIFGGKDELFKETFRTLDEEFACFLAKERFVENTKETDIKSHYYKIFEKIWQYVMSNREKCSYFIRYYYSRYYNDYNISDRKALYDKVLEKMRVVFDKNTDVWLLLNDMFDIMFSSAVKVLRGEVPDNETTVKHVFDMLYRSLMPY